MDIITILTAIVGFVIGSALASVLFRNKWARKWTVLTHKQHDSIIRLTTENEELRGTLSQIRHPEFRPENAPDWSFLPRFNSDKK